jgi:hypothetical protein
MTFNMHNTAMSTAGRFSPMLASPSGHNLRLARNL